MTGRRPMPSRLMHSTFVDMFGLEEICGERAGVRPRRAGRNSSWRRRLLYRLLRRAALLRPLETYGRPLLSVEILLELARSYADAGDTAGTREVIRQARDILLQRPDLGTLPAQLDSARGSARDHANRKCRRVVIDGGGTAARPVPPDALDISRDRATTPRFTAYHQDAGELDLPETRRLVTRRGRRTARRFRSSRVNTRRHPVGVMPCPAPEEKCLFRVTTRTLHFANHRWHVLSCRVGPVRCSRELHKRRDRREVHPLRRTGLLPEGDVARALHCLRQRRSGASVTRFTTAAGRPQPCTCERPRCVRLAARSCVGRTSREQLPAPHATSASGT